VYFEFDAFMLFDPCGVNLDDLKNLFQGFIPLYMQIWAKSDSGQDLWPCVGFTAWEGADRGGQ
jgi:hypothetical protein